MRHTPYICQCCGTETTEARTVNSGHILCTADNMKLLINGSLRLDDDIVLRIVEQRGDFKIVKAFSEPKMGYWEMRKEVERMGQMDNYYFQAEY